MTDHDSNTPLWVFGYGSLIWRPDFPYVDRQPASVMGWARRFWQASHDHRGTPNAPGRVVTLVPSNREICAGVAYQLPMDSTAQILIELDYREKNGYERQMLDLEIAGQRVSGLTYLAAEGNFAYAGPMDLPQLADLIHQSHGPSGSNADYLLELADALVDLGIHDQHVQDLAQQVRRLGPY